MAHLCRSPLLVSLFSFLCFHSLHHVEAQTEQGRILINAGGPSYTDNLGNLWITDSDFTTGEAFEDHSPVAGTSEEELYQTVRLDSSKYEISVENGIYDVMLHFAEIAPDAMAVGARVFNVSVEDSVVLRNLDVYSEVGGHTALSKLATTSVDDGSLTIEFVNELHTSMISAIEIRALKPSSRNSFAPIYINAGGNTYTDTSGTTWIKDAYYTGGEVEKTFGTPKDILYTVDDELYQTARFDPPWNPALKYDIPIPNGEYAVELHFADTWHKTQKKGARIFDVTIEGSKAFTIDIFSEIGGYSALIKRTTTTVTDGLLTINLSHVQQNPKICAIAITKDEVSSSDVRINVGGGNYVDSSGNVWRADSFFNNQGAPEKWFGALKNIAGTPDDALYQSARYVPKGAAPVEYNIPVTNGNYNCILHFAEVYPLTQRIGAREFDVLIEGRMTFSDLDIFKEAGGYTALKKGAATTVQDGKLTIELRPGKAQNPKLSAIECYSTKSSALPYVPGLPTDGAKATVPLRINAGGDEFVDKLGNVWQEDVYFNTGGKVEKWFGALQNIAGTSSDELYQTARYDPRSDPSLEYNIPLDNGDYTVSLYFSENYPGAQFDNGRVFDIIIEGQVVVTGLDIYAEAGKYTALKKTVSTTVDDGLLTIAFVHGTENPKISAIEVHAGKEVSSALLLPPAAGESIYVNAGGDDYKDKRGIIWRADTFFNGGKVERLPHAVGAIVGTADDELYQTGRYDPQGGSQMTYSIPISNGDYSVTLHFAEVFNGAKHNKARVFNVVIGSSLAFKDLDIFREAGPNTALKKTASTTVTDGVLSIAFSHKKENPKISAIEIHPSSSSSYSSPLPVQQTNSLPLFINVGGGEFTDEKGRIWMEDSFYNNGGRIETTPNPITTIYGTADDLLYETARYDPLGGPDMQYDVPLPNGDYTVTLHFSENYKDAMYVGARVFDVSLEGKKAMTVDIYDEVGSFTALKKSAPTTVSDRVLTISFSHTIENPKVSAIEIHKAISFALAAPPIPTSYFVNVGGGSFKDSSGRTWQADDYYNEGGKVESVPNAVPSSISGTLDNKLYKSARFDLASGVALKYNFPLIDGDYKVELYFSELYSGAFVEGARVFDVLLEGAVVLNDLDIYAEVGQFAALKKTVYATVSDGALTVEFGRVAENPKLCGISIEKGEIPAGQNSHRAHAVPGGPYTQTDTDGNNVETIRVDGSFSHTHTAGSKITSWTWKVNGNVVGTGEYAELTLDVGVHTLFLDVVDSDGDSSSDFTTITVKPEGFPDISYLSPSIGDIAGGEKVTIKGSGFGTSATQATVHFGSHSLTGPSAIKVVDDNTIEILKAPKGVFGPIEVVVDTHVGPSNRAFYTYEDRTLPPVVFSSGASIKGIYGPTTIAFGPDGKMYVGTQGGTLLKCTLDEEYNVIHTVESNVVATSEPAFRSILGIAFDPMDTSLVPTVYVAHSSLFHGQVVNYNGKVSAVSGETLDQIEHIITGLPVSDHDHGINGIEFGDNGELYVQVGGNTNAGVPGVLSSSGQQDEGVLSAATLVAHLSRPNFDGFVQYDPNGDQIAGFDVEVFASGQRNPFDIVLHSNGKLYGTDNGANNDYGAKSIDCNTDGSDPHEADRLNLLVEGGYYGHANRKRGEKDPRQCKWRSAYEESDSEYTAPVSILPASCNGITEFQTKHFGGQLRGKLLIGRYKGAVFLATLSSDGESVVKKPSPLKGGGGLDVTQGPDGTIFLAQNNNGQVLFHSPKEQETDSLLVHSVFPRRGPQSGESVLTIYGQNLNVATPQVKVGGKNCPVTSVTATKLTCTLPSGTGRADVVVTAGSKADVLTEGYRYISGKEK